MGTIVPRQHHARKRSRAAFAIVGEQEFGHRHCDAAMDCTQAVAIGGVWTTTNAQGSQGNERENLSKQTAGDWHDHDGKDVR